MIVLRLPVNNVALVTGWSVGRAFGENGDFPTMTKLIGLFLLLVMAVQLIYPLGLPGLRHRRDFWKLAVFAFAIWSAVLLLRP